jgi:hypothetical protein
MVWFSERVHDDFADYRRVARVFIKPATKPADTLAFLNGLRQPQNVAEKLDSVALVIQSLLIDRTGKRPDIGGNGVRSWTPKCKIARKKRCLGRRWKSWKCPKETLNQRVASSSSA